MSGDKFADGGKESGSGGNGLGCDGFGSEDGLGKHERSWFVVLSAWLLRGLGGDGQGRCVGGFGGGVVAKPFGQEADALDGRDASGGFVFCRRLVELGLSLWTDSSAGNGGEHETEDGKQQDE